MGAFSGSCVDDLVLIFKPSEADPALPFLFRVLHSCAGLALLPFGQRFEMNIKPGFPVEINGFTQPGLVRNELPDPSLLLKLLGPGFVLNPQKRQSLCMKIMSWLDMYQKKVFVLL